MYIDVVWSLWPYCDHLETIIMGTIYKRGKNWYLDVRAHGRRIRKRVGSSKKIALLALQDAEVKVARDEFGFAKNCFPSD